MNDKETPPLTSETLDAMHAAMHEKIEPASSDETFMALQAPCHPDTVTRIIYDKSKKVLICSCLKCSAEIFRVRVASETAIILKHDLDETVRENEKAAKALMKASERLVTWLLAIAIDNKRPIQITQRAMAEATEMVKKSTNKLPTPSVSRMPDGDFELNVPQS